MPPEPVKVTVTMDEMHRRTREIVQIAADGVPVKVTDGRSGKVRAWLVPPGHDLAVPA
jgi:antitoxin (DNA-binding transcriptional repressor) of toxin-antitoxin stability system